MHTTATPAGSPALSSTLPAPHARSAAAPKSSVSRGALYAAAAAAALSLLLLTLGAGLGLTTLSPWSQGAQPIGVGTILWIGFMQLAVCALGGYLAGRWRAKWVGPDNEEIHARDRSNALPAWILASLVTVVLLSGAGRSLISSVVDVGSGAAAAVAATVPAGPAAGAHLAGFWHAALVGTPTESTVAQHAAPVPAAHAVLWMLVSLVLGAITATLAATFGGLQRDGLLLQLREN